MYLTSIQPVELAVILDQEFYLAKVTFYLSVGAKLDIIYIKRVFK
jgi:hypothetical protein